MDAVGADDADGAVHLRLAEGRREAARLHQEVNHVHLEREGANLQIIGYNDILNKVAIGKSNSIVQPNKKEVLSVARCAR